VLSPEVVERIKEARQDGQTLAAIADSLNYEGVPTAHQGAKWRSGDNPHNLAVERLSKP